MSSPPFSAEATLSSCPPLPTQAATAEVIPGHNLHQLFAYISIPLTIFTVIVSLALVIAHLSFRGSINEQKQLVRTSILPAIFSIFGVSCVLKYDAGTYLDPIPKLYEVFVVACFFTFLVELVTPDLATRDKFYANLERRGNFRGNKVIHDRGSLRWYKAQCLSVFQSPLIILLITIGEEITAALMCKTRKPYEFSRGILEVLGFISTAYSLLGIIRYYRRLSKELKEHNALTKLFAFKAAVFLIIHQRLVISILQISRVVNPTPQMSGADFRYGIPEFMICAEMWAFPLWYWWAFSPFEYRRMMKQSGPDASVAAYIFAILNPWDIIKSVFGAIGIAGQLMRGPRHFSYSGNSSNPFSRQDSYGLLEAAGGNGLKPGYDVPLPDRSRSPSPSPVPAPHAQHHVPAAHTSDSYAAGDYHYSNSGPYLDAGHP